MVLSMIIGNSFWKFCSAEKPMFKGQPFLKNEKAQTQFSLLWPGFKHTKEQEKNFAQLY